MRDFGGCERCQRVRAWLIVEAALGRIDSTASEVLYCGRHIGMAQRDGFVVARQATAPVREAH